MRERLRCDLVFEASKALSDKWSVAGGGVVGLRHYEATIDEALLQQDARKSLYSSMVSIADAFRGIEAGYYSWGGVKLYYSVFYSIRAALALDRFCIFYIGKKPKWTRVEPGALPHNPSPRGEQTTHKVVLNLFRQKLSGVGILSQSIDAEDPFDWMVQRREEFNYKQAKFSEPGVPECFNFIARTGLRKSVLAYVEDSTSLYAFDKDHAIVAYPLEVLKWIRGRWPKTVWFADQDKENIRSMLVDRHGPINGLGKIIDEKS